MIIRVTQPNNGSASHVVRIILDGNYIGTIGPGGTITGQPSSTGNEPWHLIAVYGVTPFEKHPFPLAT